MIQKLVSSLGLLASICLLQPTALLAEDWPQWRGPNRDDISKESGLLQTWPAGGPKRVWTFKNAGLGYAGPAIADGKLFIMGTRNNSEILMALDANTGAELWAATMGNVLDNNWGDGPRGTPTVDQDRVYALSGEGHLICASTTDGTVHWKKSMRDLGGSVPGWGYTESVLVDGPLVLCTPGGDKGAVAALDKLTGDLVWQSEEFTDGAQYASIIVATPHGQKQYVQLTMEHIVGLSPKDGSVLWTSDWPGRTAVIPTPIYHNNHVYVTSGYSVGCKLIRIEKDNSVTEVYDNKVMKNHHGGVLLHDEHIYGYSDGVGWVCQDFMSGEEVWSERSLGKGAVTYADNRLYCLEESQGLVVLLAASPDGYKEHGRFKLEPQSEQRSRQGRIWTHPVVANGKLYLRDQELIHCYDVAAQTTGS